MFDIARDWLFAHMLKQVLGKVLNKGSCASGGDKLRALFYVPITGFHNGQVTVSSLLCLEYLCAVKSNFFTIERASIWQMTEVVQTSSSHK